MTRNDPSIKKDEWLANFADQILNGETDSLPAEGLDPELRTLAGTLLRIKRAFPNQELDPAAVKRMRAEVLKKWREEEQKKPRWLKFFQLSWINPPQRQQFITAFALIVMMGIAIVVAPFLFSINGGLTGTAGTSMPGALIWVALAVLVVVIAWLLRRK